MAAPAQETEEEKQKRLAAEAAANTPASTDLLTKTQNYLGTLNLSKFPDRFAPTNPLTTASARVEGFQNAQRDFEKQAREKADRWGLLSKPGPDGGLRPLADFRAELDTNKEIGDLAQKDLNNQRESLSLARANIRNIRTGLARGRVFGAGEIESAKNLARTTDAGMGQTDNVDTRMKLFKDRISPYDYRLKKNRGQTVAAV